MATPIRTLHHLACTGGTLIAKIIAGMPNVVLLNEIDPLSRLHLKAEKQPFAPTDPIAALRYCRRDVDDGTIAAMFTASLRVLKDELDATGRYLVLRDHAHSQFCLGNAVTDRPDLRAIVRPLAPLQSVVTVRHPLASYVSLSERKWVHFRPATLSEYATRYTMFLDMLGNIPLHRYEDIVADPAPMVQRLCSELDLPFTPDFEATLPIFALSGDSGRSGTTVQPRPDKPVPAPIAHEAEASETYARLCARLGY